MERCNRMNIDNEVKCSIKYIYGSIKKRKRYVEVRMQTVPTL